VRAAIGYFAAEVVSFAPLLGYEQNFSPTMKEPVMYPKIDILLMCYNLEQYIDQAIDSIFYQNYSGGMKVIVADDCSTDETLQKVHRRAQQRRDVSFEFLRNDRNLGITKNYQRAFAACRSPYIAILDGDDYWINSEKLAKQITFLEANSDCVMCGCNYYILNEESQVSRLRVPVTTGNTKYDSYSIIKDNIVSNFSTSVYRGAAIASLPMALFDRGSIGCWGVNICCGIHGNLGFLNEALSVYRVHAKGKWGGKSSRQMIEKRIALTYDYDKVTEGRFHHEFENLRTTLIELLKEQQKRGAIMA
jgi:glycosyltransferase involved in cell wall biosynthesis